MRGKFSQILTCLIKGHIECECDSCSADKEYSGKHYIRICKRCDGDY